MCQQSFRKGLGYLGWWREGGQVAGGDVVENGPLSSRRGGGGQTGVSPSRSGTLGSG